MTPEDLLVRANLAAGLVSCFLYGIFLVLFVASTYLFIVRRTQATGNRSWIRTLLSPIICLSILMFITVTGTCVCAFIQVFEAFITFNHGTTPLLVWGDLSRTSEVAKAAFLLTSLIIGDLMILYRLWVVWDYSYYIVALPTLCIIALTVSSINLTYQFSQFKLGQEIFNSLAGRWITSDFVCILVTNLYCTSLIIWRISKVKNAVQTYGGRRLASLLVMLVESASILTTWVIVVFVTYQTHTNMTFFMQDVLPMVSGIAVMLINVGVVMGSTFRVEKTATFPGTHSSSNSTFPPQLETGGRYGHKPNNAYPMSPFAVKVTRVVGSEQSGIHANLKENSTSVLPRMISSMEGPV